MSPKASPPKSSHKLIAISIATSLLSMLLREDETNETTDQPDLAGRELL